MNMCKKISVTILVVFLCFMSYTLETTMAGEIISGEISNDYDHDLTVEEESREEIIPPVEENVGEELQNKEPQNLIEDRLEYSEMTLEEVVLNLCRETEPIQIIMKLNGTSNSLYFPHFSDKEYYQFISFYQYTLMSELIEDLTVEVPHYSQEQLEEMMAVFQELIVQSWGNSQWTKKEREELYEDWNKELLDLLETAWTNRPAHFFTELNRFDVDLDSYKAQIGSSAEFDIDILLELMDNMRYAEDEEILSESLNSMNKFLHEQYGYTEVVEIGTLTHTVEPLRTDAVARVGNTYFSTFDKAFAALPDGGTMYVMKDCVAGHNITTKSFTILPEGKDIVITASSSLGSEPAGIIAVPNGTPSGTTGTWTFSGNNGYTLTLDGNRRGSSGILSVLCRITVNLKDGVRLQNGMANGVWNSLGVTNVYRDVLIYNNIDAGIASQGTVNLYGGQIYNNGTNGIRAQAIYMTDGRVYNNRKSGLESQGVDNNTSIRVEGGEIYNNILDGITAYAANGVCTTTITGGKIYSNHSAGVRSQVPSGTLHISGETEISLNLSGVITISTTYFSGGTIHDHREGGINSTKSLTMSGGSIYSNKTTQYGGGIYNAGKLILSGGRISSNNAIKGGGIYNDIYGELRVTGGTVTENSSSLGGGVYQNGNMFMSGLAEINQNNDIYLPEIRNAILVEGTLKAEQAARITPSVYALGRACVKMVYDIRKGSNIYQKFVLTPYTYHVLRPGDYQVADAKTNSEDVVISRAYSVHYEKNYDDSNIQVPLDSEKYWFELGKVSVDVPAFGKIHFKGWGEDKAAKIAAFQPGDDISASLNKDMILFAIWDTQIKITYTGIYADSGNSRSEIFSLEESKANHGYEIKKNADYTKFVRNGYAFAGWSDSAEKNETSEVKYPEYKMNKVGFEELYEIAKTQQIDIIDQSKIPEVILYDVWNQNPKIIAEEVLEFYEGTTVTKDMLLKNVKADDKEDGNITENIRIVSIEYSKTGYLGSSRPEHNIQTWEEDMPNDYRVDTWFMKLIKENSPVVHKITYAVTDSLGTEVRLEWELKVKYNEYPIIKGEDRYFTLEEARSGNVTEEILVKKSLESGRLIVTDKEDDQLYPGTISQKVELVDFHPEEFTSFEESGYVVLTYSVKDSMGPDEAGKETLTQFTVYVVNDGEIIRPESKRYVRFINKENYNKNAFVNVDDIGSEDKEHLNKNGGLDLESKWYKIPEYRSLLSTTFENRKHADAVWKFSKGNVEAVKHYIEVHGLGNSKEEHALTRFAEKFKH